MSLKDEQTYLIREISNKSQRLQTITLDCSSLLIKTTNLRFENDQIKELILNTKEKHVKVLRKIEHYKKARKYHLLVQKPLAKA